MRVYNNIKRRIQKIPHDLRSRLFRQQNSIRRDSRPDHARGSIEKGRCDIRDVEIDRLQMALRGAESENKELKVTIEKLLERSFDQSLESKLHQTICDLREENKILSKRNNDNDILIDDLEKNYEKIRHEFSVLKHEMERDFVECPNLHCKEKFRSNELLKRHKRFNCRGAERSMEAGLQEAGETAAKRTRTEGKYEI